MRIRKKVARNERIKKSGLSSQKVSERLRECGCAKERRNEGESVSEVERK